MPNLKSKLKSLPQITNRTIINSNAVYATNLSRRLLNFGQKENVVKKECVHVDCLRHLCTANASNFFYSSTELR